MYSYFWIGNILYQNKDAILALPYEVKVIALITLALMFGTSIIKKAKNLLKFAIIATVLYFVLTYFGIL